MAAAPWVISILSTDYDLHDYRTAVISQLRSKRVNISAFELPDFPVEPDIHSHESCIRALDRADIALLVIDKRYGGIYVGDLNASQSITEAEYLAMIEKRKPCFVFVSRASWNERHAYKTQLKTWIERQSYTPEQLKTDIPKKTFDEEYKCTYVKSVNVIDFIEKIQRTYKKHSFSNWIDQYENIPDLLTKVEGKLRGHSRFLLESLICEQKKNLESRHTSTGLSLSLGDVFSRGYYMEPSFEQESGNLQAGASLDNMICNTLRNGDSILIYGEAGYGKTTILAKSFLSHAESFFRNDSYEIPFYLWLKKKNSDYHFNFSTYVDESFVDDWNRKPYPYMDLSSIRPVFYFDGFDEVAEKMSPDDVEQISRADIFNYPVLLTCRQQYAFRYISNFSFADRFSCRTKIKTWTEGMAKSYIDNFCFVKGKSPDFASTVHQLLADNQALCNILNNPLLITMLLWIIEQNRMRIPETIHTRVQLFRACIDELAKRELSRLDQRGSFLSDLENIWSYTAWEVYYNKLRGLESKISAIIPKIKKLLPGISLDFSSTHFEALFDSVDDRIFGTFHEQFLEYLVANCIFFACKTATYPYPEFLGYVMRPEINRYFRAIWNECIDNDKKTVVKNLHTQYLSNLGDDSFFAVSKRVHAIYHIARFNLPEREDMINRAFNSETHISVLLSLYFGAIKMGRFEDEDKFYELLSTNQEYNVANRGYHLAYYSDAIMSEQLPFRDNNQMKWEGTLRAFLRHFDSDDVEHYYLRRIDLLTMKQFIEARGKVEPLTEELIKKLRTLIETSNFRTVYPVYQAKIEKTFDELLNVVQNCMNQ